MSSELPPLPREYTQVILSTGDATRLAAESYDSYGQAIAEDVTHWVTVDYYGCPTTIPMDSVVQVSHVTADGLARWEQELARDRAREREEARLRAIYGDDYEPDA